MMHELKLTPRDPLIARDGRPFGAGQGQRMRSLDWFYPSVVAGSLRTLLGKQTDPSFSADTIKVLKALSISGPLPIVDDTLFFPRPHDCLVSGQDRLGHSIRPMTFQEGEGSDLPDGLHPVLLPDGVEDFKPIKNPPAFWSGKKMVQWLIRASKIQIPDESLVSDGFLDAPPRDLRFHVKMDPNTGAGLKEDALFLTAGLDLSRKNHSIPICLSVRVNADNGFSKALQGLNTMHPMGGERRLVHWQSQQSRDLWQYPKDIKNALSGASCVRMILASPAIFANGWKPGWLKNATHGLEGEPPGLKVKLRLIGVIIDRWLPLSGWSLEAPVGPKAVRRMVPAGGTYFFKVVDNNAQDLTPGWLQSVCDEEQDRRDGFGLALWGVWNEHDLKNKEG
ncbi:MAG: type III-B CRISPR module-associated protein Cmr3 [Syntrophaceae bacterium]|nr:type III-B CRISPR module-associated protein Cmr3 [Syntrophaceae bacterium]